MNELISLFVIFLIMIFLINAFVINFNKFTTPITYDIIKYINNNIL
jgi:hypothetical protein